MNRLLNILRQPRHSSRQSTGIYRLARERVEERCCLSAVAFASAEMIQSEGSSEVRAVDIDDDGDLDVLSYSANGDTIAWYENIDGQGHFGPPNVVTDQADGMDVADVDGDGDVDVVSTFFDRIVWHQNTDGQGTFALGGIVASEVGWINSVRTADIDGDGDIDVLSADWYFGKLTWHENVDGKGVFGPPRESGVGGRARMHPADLDGDADVDVAFGAVSPRVIGIVWYENVFGDGTFGPHRTVEVDNDLALWSVHVEDIDGDDDLDIISASRPSGVGAIFAWYENVDGHGTFGLPNIIAKREEDAESIYAVDLDGDGDVDVISAAVSQHDGMGRLAWHENVDGRGSFGPERLITNKTDYFAGIHAGDVDGDGDIDVLAATGSQLVWFKNSTPGDATLDGKFNQLDIVQVLQAGKYLTGKPSAFEEGDWNEDGVFDQDDIIAALQAGTFGSDQ